MEVELTKDICKNIDIIRKVRGMSITKLSRLSGVSRQAIYNWSSGKAVPSIKLIPIICEALETTPNVLFNIGE